MSLIVSGIMLAETSLNIEGYLFNRPLLTSFIFIGLCLEYIHNKYFRRSIKRGKADDLVLL